MSRKYEFTGETKTELGVTLRRIVAVSEFAGVAVGDVGGWIESDKNLAQSGNAWVSGNARVYGDAWVSGNARVYGDARVLFACSETPCVLTGFPHVVTITDHHITVGCQSHCVSVWRERGQAIIKADGHTTEHAKAWHAIIMQIADAHGCVPQEKENNT